MTNEINIYVADLAAYNNAILHGVWIDATQDVEGIWNDINAMLKASPIDNAEEYAIHDYEGFQGVRLSEYEGIEATHNIACFIKKNGKLGAELLDYYELEQAERVMTENYHGCFTSVAEYVEQLLEETNDIPHPFVNYIDYERMGRDMELSGDIFTIETAHDEVHVFWN